MKMIATAATGVFLLGAAAAAQAQPGAMATPPPQPTAPAERNADPTQDPDSPAGTNPAPESITEPPAAMPDGSPRTATSDSGTTTAVQAAPGPWMSRAGAALMVGGGFEDFTSSNLRSMTSGGGSWTARLVGGTRQLVGVEAAYVGAVRNIDGFGLGDDTRLVSNGVEGAVRANFPVEYGQSLLLPFAFAGLGWQHYSLMNAPAVNVSAISGSDDVMSLPAGAGVEYSYGMFIADARFTYRYTFLNDLMRTGGGRLSTYGVTAQVGVEF